jgi:hypothetical protein
MKSFLDLDKKGFLLNEQNSEKTDAFFGVEVVPKDKGVEVLYPQTSIQVHILGV